MDCDGNGSLGQDVNRTSHFVLPIGSDSETIGIDSETISDSLPLAVGKCVKVQIGTVTDHATTINNRIG